MITDRIQREHHLLALHHLTCVNSTREQIAGAGAGAQAGHPQHPGAARRSARRRGRIPEDRRRLRILEGTGAYIRQINNFSIGVAGFPEGHIACKEGKQVDWQRLDQKIDAGADFVVTQLFFDNADFYEFNNT